MRALLFAVGMLATLSGGLKFRGRVMNKIGTSPLALGEVGSGIVACLVAVLVSESGLLHPLLAGLTLAFVLAASYHQSKLTAQFSRRRELSESHRLKHFVESQDATGTPDPEPSGEDHGT